MTLPATQIRLSFLYFSAVPASAIIFRKPVSIAVRAFIKCIQDFIKLFDCVFTSKEFIL